MRQEQESAALVVIDLQNDFCPGGSLPVPLGDLIVPAVNRLMPLFPVVVATQDWHPRDHVSLASNNPGAKLFEVVERFGISQTVWPDHCVQGTSGAELHAQLDVPKVGLILRKGMRRELDSYSAFFENDRRTSTGLAGYLRERGVTTVYLCGLAADVCVYYSAMDAVRLGLSTVVVEDAVRGLDLPPGSLARRFGEMRAAGVRILQSAAVAEAAGRSGKEPA